MEPDPRAHVSDAYAIGCSLIGGLVVVLLLLGLAIVSWCIR